MSVTDDVVEIAAQSVLTKLIVARFVLQRVDLSRISDHMILKSKPSYRRYLR